MKDKKLKLAMLASLAALSLSVLAAPSGSVFASSHREAPFISTDPSVDNTDVYAFVSPDAPTTVTIIGDWIPLEQAASGPNFFKFADDAVYEINLDTMGNARASITYQFQFHSQTLNANTFLYNTGPVNNINDSTLNVRQFYSVTRIRRDASSAIIAKDVLAQNVPVAPANIGPRSTPNYPNLANQAITALSGGGKVFAGPRDDPFFIDIGSAFDLLGLRPLNSAHAIPLPNAPGVDGLAGYNIHAIAFQVPISTLQLSNGVFGVWAQSKRLTERVFTQGGVPQDTGIPVQVSRLGMPLVNEVIIPLAKKDIFNSSRPDVDAQFGSFVLNPEIVGLINTLYASAIPASQRAPTTNRTDLATVFLTGIPGVNQLPRVTPSEMIRLNTEIAPSANPNRLGVVGGDNAGFPNGRRLADDTPDIELRALECSYGVVGTVGPCDSATYNKAPNNALTDGVDANDVPFLTTFPYEATPHQGYEQIPPESGAQKAGVALAGTSALAGAALIFFYWRKRKVTHSEM